VKDIGIELVPTCLPAGSITRRLRSTAATRTFDSFAPFLSVIKKLYAFVCKGFIIELRLVRTKEVAVFEVIKYQYIYPHDPDAREKLRSLLAFAFHEYDTIRPHGSLGGLTPDESYRGVKPDREKEKLHLNAPRTERRAYNLKNQCGKCTVLEL
jgi:hypothetical protein